MFEKTSTRKKAHGIDELPSNLLKDAANKISQPLTFIINKALSSGIVPHNCPIQHRDPRDPHQPNIIV